MRVTKNFLLLCLFAGSLNATAQDQTARGIGSGILYAAPNLATLRNPIATVDSPPTSFLGLYRFDPELAFASLSMGAKAFGGALAFRQENSGTENVNVFEGSLGFRSSFILVGGTVRKVDDGSLDGDFAMAFDMGWGRLGGVLRNIDNGVDRADLGLAFKMSNSSYFEMNLKSSDPYGSRPWLADVAFVVHAHDWTIGAGYDFWYTDDGIENGEFHGSISLQITESFYADTHYRLANQEWSANQWTAGARILF